DGDTARAALANGPIGGAAARTFADGVHFGTALAMKDLVLATKTTELPALEAVLADYRRAADDPALAQADISRAAARIRTP
ncbi:NAD(P)-dependent oxidoreductase, partial [Streptomyces hyaluromycini]